MKIANKIRLSFLIVAVIIATLAMSILYSIVRKDLLVLVNDRMDSLVYSRARHIETYLDMLKVSIGQLSRSVVLENLLRATKEKPETYRNAFEIATKRLVRTKEADPSIVEYLLLDATGKVVASSNEKSVGRNMSADDYFIGGKKDFYVKDVYRYDAAQEGVMGASGPMRNSETGELMGVVVSIVNLKDLYAIVTEGAGFGKTEEIIVINKDGYMITPSRFLEGTFLKQKVDTENSRACLADRDVGGSCHVKGAMIIGLDYRGVMIAGSNAYIREMQWCVLSEIDKSEVLAPLTQIRLALLIIFCGVLIGVWLLGTVLSVVITDPIHRLHRGTEIIGAGNLEYTVATDARDEIGQLSRAFDKMTSDLRNTTTSVDNLNKEVAQRKRTEAALKESQRKIRAVLDQTFQLIGLLDSDGILLDVNKSALDLAGIKESAVLNKPFWEAPWWEHSAPLREKLRDAITKGAAGKPSRFEATHIAKDGSTHYIDFSLKPVKDGAGKIIFLLPEGHDITELKKAQEQLAATAREWETTFNSIPDLIAIYDKDYRIVKVNASYARFFKTSPAALVGRLCYEVVHDLHVPFQGCPHKKTMETGAPHISEFFEPRLGIYVEASTSPIFDSKKNLLGTVHIIKDITKRREGEIGARRLAAIVESSDDAIIGKDLNGTITSWNAGAERLYGYSAQEVIGKDIAIIVPSEHRDELDVFSQKAKNGKSVIHYETVRMRKDGTTMPVSLTTSPIRDSIGTIIGISTIAHDISERKKLEALMKKYNEDLEREVEEKTKALRASQDSLVRAEKLAMVGKLASSVAHELRNPLGVIKNAIYYLNMLESAKSDPEIGENMDIISQEVENSDRIITDLLEFSRSKKPILRPENVNLIIKEMLDRLKINPDVTVVLELKDGLPDIEVDALQMHQVFYNMAKNAAESMEKGGQLKIGTALAGEDIKVSFSDTGSGISEENMGKIFEPLFSTKTKGTGLGLSVCASIVENHNGKIEVASEAGKGTTFTITLPVKTSGG